jgi:mRNA interferase RelE/StbE
MPNYQIVLSRKAQKQLDKFSDTIAQPIFDAITGLEKNPIGYKKLKGRESFRIRVGNYRIIYEIFENKLIVEVVTLGHRKDIYN